MKKLMALTVALATILCTVPGRALAESGVLGDADGDGAVNHLDIVRVKSFLANRGRGAGLWALLGAEIVPGIDAILTAMGADKAFAEADLIVTGEGKTDGQSLSGKLISGIAKRTGRTPVLIIAGVVDCPEEALKQAGIWKAAGVHPKPVPMEVAAANAFSDLEQAAEKVFRTL